MFSWYWLLLAWALLWALQSIGVWYQTNRYGDQLKALQSEFTTGYMGTGHEPRRFGKGSIVMLVLSPEMIVKRFLVMRGTTIFASFQPINQYEGLTLAALNNMLADMPKKSSLKGAAQKSIDQIVKVQRDRLKTQAVGNTLAHV